MTLPQHILHNEASTVSFDGAGYVQPSNAATTTVSLYTGDGDTIFANASATIASLSTTLSSAASRDDTTLALTNASGLTAGDYFWSRLPDERHRAKTISGNTVTLWQPVRHAHANAVTIEATSLSKSVNAANAATLFWDGRLVWKADGVTLATQSCICTKYRLERMATGHDLAEEHAKLNLLVPQTLDVERLLDRGFEEVVRRLAAISGGRAHTWTSADQFIVPTVYAAMAFIFQPRSGDAAQQLWERYRTLLAEELGERVAGYAVRDGDQDGVIEADEQRSRMSARLYRG